MLQEDALVVLQMDAFTVFSDGVTQICGSNHDFVS